MPEQATEAGPGTGRRAGPGTPPGAEDHTERQSTTREPDGGGGAADHRPRFGEAAVARLAGGQPVDPETARLLAERATSWVRLFTDPIGGHVVAVDTYTPSDRLKRLLRARDQHCRWPGCDQRAARCDIDHTRPWAEGGKTHVGNLAHLCRRHHTLKGARLSGARRWKVRQSSPGVLEFTSPMGQTYIDEPPRVGPVFRDGAAADAWAASGSADRGELPF